VAVYHRLGNREGEAVGLSNLGYNYVRLGLYDQGTAALERALQLAAGIGYRRLSAYSQLNLALAHCRAGDAGTAQRLLEQYIPELAAVNDRFGQAVGQSYYALAQEQSGDKVGAREHFLAARRMLLEIGVSGYAHDALAGLARCLLSLGHLEEAGQHASTVWDYLAQHGPGGMEFPILAYQTCADVYEAQGDSESAHAAVEMGYRRLMARADRISEPAWRRSFLDDVPEHRRIVQKWKKAHH
jgi:tetratricopeptide (TPR) repeat protein